MEPFLYVSSLLPLGMVCVCVCVREEALSEIMMMHSSYTEIGSAVLS